MLLIEDPVSKSVNYIRVRLNNRTCINVLTTLIHYFYVHLYVYDMLCELMSQYMCGKSRDNSLESVLSLLLYVGSRIKLRSPGLRSMNFTHRAISIAVLSSYVSIHEHKLILLTQNDFSHSTRIWRRN